LTSKFISAIALKPNPSLKPSGWTAIASLGLIRLNDRAKLYPGNDLIHRRQKHISFGRTTVLLKSSGHDSPLLQGFVASSSYNASDLSAQDLISAALTPTLNVLAIGTIQANHILA
jgi:hypothetical protein